MTVARVARTRPRPAPKSLGLSDYPDGVRGTVDHCVRHGSIGVVIDQENYPCHVVVAYCGWSDVPNNEHVRTGTTGWLKLAPPHTGRLYDFIPDAPTAARVRRVRSRP